VQGESVPKRGVPQPIRGGPIKFGRYLLEARIAVGGTAEVYLARPLPADELGHSAGGHTELPRLIIKRLLPHFLIDPEGRTMFEREAALHTAVHHENVVEVYGSGLSDTGEPYLAMEYVDGVDTYRLLRRFRNEGKALPTHVAVHIVTKVLAALESVHSATDEGGTPLGIIHRDVTPSNLYLSKDGRVKLGDFGIARSTQRATMRNAASAMLKGKIAYLAPEQVAGEPFDYRADLFSVATVLTEMLIGQPLFPGGGQLAILLAIRDCRIEPLREAKDRVPPLLFDSLLCALSREPKSRFQSAADFAAAIGALDPNPHATAKELGIYVGRAQGGATDPGATGGRASRPSSSGKAVPPPLPAARKRTPAPVPSPFDGDDVSPDSPHAQPRHTPTQHPVRESREGVRGAGGGGRQRGPRQPERAADGAIRAPSVLGRHGQRFATRTVGIFAFDRGDRHRRDRSERSRFLHGARAAADRKRRRARTLSPRENDVDDEPFEGAGCAGFS